MDTRADQIITALRAGHESLAAFVSGKAVHAVSCEDAAWVFAGLSMAGWNALISVGLAVLSAIAAVRERAKQ